MMMTPPAIGRLVPHRNKRAVSTAAPAAVKAAVTLLVKFNNKFLLRGHCCWHAIHSRTVVGVLVDADDIIALAVSLGGHAVVSR
jgi:hypothetical protein